MKTAHHYCRIYVADVTPLASSALFHRFYMQMPASRREKIDRIRFAEGKQLSLGAGALLNLALRSAGIEGPSANFAEGPHGKPFLRDRPDIFFSLSHSGRRVLCVLSDLVCGGDVEQIGRGSPALARRFFTDEESAALAAEASAGGEEAFQRLFARIWTRKESLLKATGDGLFRPLSSFSVLSPDPDVLFLEAAPEKKYASCVCLLRNCQQTEWPRAEWIPISLDETFPAL